jgi:twitching motility protein PilT
MMQAGQIKHGMQTFNQALATLYHRRMISLQVALAYSSYPDELQDMINRGVGTVNTTPDARRAGRS